jgi:hypothetical protein
MKVTQLIAKLLDGHRTDSNIALTMLLHCPVAKIFNVMVLKALLQFVNEEEDAMKDKVLGILIMKAELQVEFLKSTSSFVVRILAYFEKPFQPKIAQVLL